MDVAGVNERIAQIEGPTDQMNLVPLCDKVSYLMLDHSTLMKSSLVEG
jgi:hypothetical protein